MERRPTALLPRTFAQKRQQTIKKPVVTRPAAPLLMPAPPAPTTPPDTTVDDSVPPTTRLRVNKRNTLLNESPP